MPIPTPFRYANFINTELLEPIAAGDTTIRIPVSVSQALPTLVPPEKIMLALWDGQQAPELVGVTDNPQSGFLTVERAMESTSGVAWDAGTQVKCVLSAGIIDAALQAYFDLPGQLTGFYLPLSGGTLDGPLFLPLEANPVTNQAVTKGYVDVVSAGYMKADGSIPMTGNLVMSNNSIVGLGVPTLPASAATKDYVDTKVAAGGGGGGGGSSGSAYADDSYGEITTGTGAAYIVPIVTDHAGVFTNVSLTFRPHVDSERGCTLTVQKAGATVLAAKPIWMKANKDPSYRMLQAGTPYRVTYNGTAWVLHNIPSMATEVDTGQIVFEPKAGAAAKTGYVRLHGGTIGLSAGSEGFGAAFKDLYIYNWGNFDNTLCPVAGGRGADASSDWTANKALTLLDARGKGIAGTDTTASPAGRITAGSIVTGAIDKAGSSGGLEKRKVLQTNLPAYTLPGSISLNNNTDLVQIGNAAGELIEFDGYNAPGSGAKDRTYVCVRGGPNQLLSHKTVTGSGGVTSGGGGLDFLTMDPFMLGTFYQRM